MAQHLSARIPWKDNGYTGLVCNKPCYNNACLRLKNIAESRDDDYEMERAGKRIEKNEDRIPCLSEGGCFMSEDTFTRISVHPYKENNKKTHGHFLETELTFPPFSYPARPFAWTMLRKGGEKNDENIRKKVEQTGMNYDPDREPDLGFETNWVQDAENQREIFRTFYEDVIPGESLLIPYAKQVPFVDESRRVVMGLGVVTSIIEPPEHNHTEDGDLRSILWETMLGHSIRDDRKNGFLLPYREMMAYAEEHPEFDMRSITVFADDEYFEEFSYATEWLSYDAVISVLLRVIQALEIIRDCIPGNWGECIKWTRKKLEDVWNDRGVYPGLGSMLSAVGIPRGEVIAKELKSHITNSEDYESVLIESLKNPEKYFSKKVLSVYNKTDAEVFCALPKERLELFWLLSRMTLSNLQASGVFYPENRKKRCISATDNEIIENPYLLFELTLRLSPEYSIGVKTIDMALLTPEFVRNKSALPEHTRLDSENDKRRIRAYMIALLEVHAINGHTVYPVSFLIEEMNKLPIDPQCKVTSDMIVYMADYLEKKLYPIECQNSEKAYQLERLHTMDEVIRKSVSARISGARHDVPEDWRAIVDNAFPEKKGDFEEKAREEKAAVLKELAESRLSVLTGGAGTGKTTLLALLCKSKKIQNGGILLLAPTGKARVRMSQAMRQQGVTASAKTVAQFLSESKRFFGLTMEYRLSNEIAKDVPETVIIDESSMLTEEMFAALLEALKKNAKRIIFVGDQNQLPPIGAGRPFVDLVNHLGGEQVEFPRVTKGFGQLTVTMRQVSTDGRIREDMELAKWYTENPDNLDEDVFLNLQVMLH